MSINRAIVPQTNVLVKLSYQPITQAREAQPVRNIWLKRCKLLPRHDSKVLPETKTRQTPFRPPFDPRPPPAFPSLVYIHGGCRTRKMQTTRFLPNQINAFPASFLAPRSLTMPRRPCTDARVYGHTCTTTAMREMSTSPPRARMLSREIATPGNKPTHSKLSSIRKKHAQGAKLRLARGSE